MNFVEPTIQAPTQTSAQLLHSLRSFCLAAVRVPLAICALGACLSAGAGTNGLDVTVATALPGQVSLGSPNLAAYKFTIKNNQSSGVNNVWLNANSSVLNGAGSNATFLQSSVSPEVCQYDATRTQVSCLLGGIDPGASVSIVLVFNSPSQGSEINVTSWIPAGQGGPSPVPGSNAFNLNFLKTTLVEAATGVNGKKGVINVSTAQSYVLATNSLSAGSLSLSGATSTVTPPTGQGVVIKQFVPASSCSAMYKTCFNTQLEIRDENGVVSFLGGTLTIVLTRSSSTLKANASIANALLQYQADGSSVWVDIGKCSVVGDPVAPDPINNPTGLNTNCIASSVVDLATGNWIHTLKASQNGLRAL